MINDLKEDTNNQINSIQDREGKITTEKKVTKIDEKINTMEVHDTG